MPATPHRRKLSTTISEESYRYLEAQVETGRATTLAEAVDRALARVRRLESRTRLEQDTAAYFQTLTGQAAVEEARLESALGQLADEVDLSG